MKRPLAVLVLAATLAAPPALAYDLLSNGGFETGTLADWQTFSQGSGGGTGGWYAHSSGNGTYSGLPTSPPPSGSWQAVADNDGSVAAILYRDVTIPATTRATLRLVLWHGNASPGGYVNGASLSPGISNQRVRVDVVDPSTPLLTTSSGVLRLVYQTTSSSPSVFPPATLTDDLTAFAGQTVRLRIAVVGANGPIIAGVDDVRLDVSPFTYSADLPGLQAAPARWADFDADGRMEVVQAGNDGANRYFQVWKWTPLFGGGWNYYALLNGLDHGGFAAGDFDHDGDLDLGAAGSTGSALRDLLVYRHDGGGAFTAVPQGGITFLEPGARDGTFAWGDANGDGRLDALFSGEADGLFNDYPSTRVGFNDGGSGWLSVAEVGLPGVVNGQTAWTDLPFDGALDVAASGSGLAALYQSDGAGGYQPFGAGLPALSSGVVAAGDLDGDNVEELVVCGLESGTPVTRVYALDGFAVSWSDWGAGLPGVHEAWLSLGDVDHDGLLDIALCGNTGSTRIARIYRNQGNHAFIDMQAGLPGVSLGSIELGDFEGDGDLDVLLQGHTGSALLTRIYLNAPPVANQPPTPPLDLMPYVYGSFVSLAAVYPGSDDHTIATNLTYNFRVGTTPGGAELVAPMSRPADGRRLLPQPGESRHAYFRRLPLLGIGHGSIYYSAQTVDQSFAGSAWSLEESFSPGPAIDEVRDVPGDQGGRVRLLLASSELDGLGTDYPAAGYNVWRLVPPGAQAEAIAREGVALAPEAAAARLLGEGPARAADPSRLRRPGSGPADLPLLSWQGRHFVRSEGAAIASAFPPGTTWEILGSFYAMQSISYLVLAETLADSGSTGPNDATFIVTVHTGDPAVWFASPPASGRSVDNLAPAAPVGLTAAHHTGSGNQLAWQPAPESDFAGFRVYRGDSPGFEPGPATLVATVTTPAWTDPAYDAPTVHYRVSTLDHAGNESPAVAPGSVTGATAEGAPRDFALGTIAPNPVRANARIAFALPRASDVKLEVYDTAGRLVRTLLDGALDAGRHEASWAGERSDGRRAAAGVYFVRLRAGSFSATRRVALAR